jgi:N-dimethylarginine dimethylaminohydrolase
MVEYHPASLDDRADAIFVFDPVLMTGRGAVLLKMGKQLRAGEETALGGRLADLGVEIVGRLEGEALAEGGDLLRLDAETLAAGVGFRTNRAGVEQLAAILADQGIEVRPFDLPCFEGPRACLHLLSLVSLLDEDLAVIYPRLMPVAFWRLLAERFEFVEVPDEEFPTMAPNVLALGPRRCLMLEGNPITRRRLERAGCEVHTYDGSELSLKAEGGPTCLTLPLAREPVGSRRASSPE